MLAAVVGDVIAWFWLGNRIARPIFIFILIGVDLLVLLRATIEYDTKRMAKKKITEDDFAVRFPIKLYFDAETHIIQVFHRERLETGVSEDGACLSLLTQKRLWPVNIFNVFLFRKNRIHLKLLVRNFRGKSYLRKEIKSTSLSRLPDRIQQLQGGKWLFFGYLLFDFLTGLTYAGFLVAIWQQWMAGSNFLLLFDFVLATQCGALAVFFFFLRYLIVQKIFVVQETAAKSKT